MKMKTIGRLAAAGLAGITAVSTMGIAASADVSVVNGVASGTIYAVTVSSTTIIGGTTINNGSETRYYTSQAAADAAAAAATGTVTKNYGQTVSSAFGSGTTVYISSDGNEISTSSSKVGTGYRTYRTSGTSTPTNPNYYYGSVHYASSNNIAYVDTNGKKWPNYHSLIAAGQTYASTMSLKNTYTEIKNSSVTGVVYFDQLLGEFTTVPSNNTVEIFGYDNYQYDYGYDYNNYDKYDVYRVNGVYYPTLSAAQSAAGNYYRIEKVRDYSAPQTNYFCKKDGLYYSTYDAALKAGGGISSNVYVFNYYNDGYYYNGYYYDYGDPYYYYWLNRQQSKKDDTNVKDTTTATVGKRKGWTSIASYLAMRKNGATVTVDMNEETVVPASVTTAIKGRNVTVKFVLDNGVVFAVNGKNISSAKEIDLDTEYNTKNIPSSLVKAAYKKNKAVSTAQITIDSDSFGFAADVTVKFSSKRAGCKAKLYRYNPSKNSLQLVDTSKIQDNGKCTFGDVEKGGDFVIVIC